MSPDGIRRAVFGTPASKAVYTTAVNFPASASSTRTPIDHSANGDALIRSQKLGAL
jgi:hypothetical protein